MKSEILVILFISIICITGCSLTEDKYKDFKHYDLTDYRYQIYPYYRTQEAEKYAVAVLTPKDKKHDGDVMGYTEGLLYEVGENDYILLDSFAGGPSYYNNESYTMLYKDKIYIIRSGFSITEYTLDKENTKGKDLKFDNSSIINKYKEDDDRNYYLYSYKIDKIENDYIHFREVSIHNASVGRLNIKCSLKDYICEETGKI